MEDGKVYSGWEIIKLLSERKFDKGDNLRDNQGNSYKVDSTKHNTLVIVDLYLNDEIGNSLFTNPNRTFYKVIR